MLKLCYDAFGLPLKFTLERMTLNIPKKIIRRNCFKKMKKRKEKKMERKKIAIMKTNKM